MHHCFPSWLSLTLQNKVGSPYWWRVVKVPAHSGFSDISPVCVCGVCVWWGGGGMPCYSCWKSRLLHSSFLTEVGVKHSFPHSDRVEKLLSLFNVAKPPFLVSRPEGMGFGEGCLSPIDIYDYLWFASFSSTQSWIYEIEEKLKEVTTVFSLKSLASLPSFLHLSVSSNACLVFNIQGF